MCTALAGKNSIMRRLIQKNPLMTKLEQKTGLRPHGALMMIGGRETNRFYQKGGDGYVDPKGHLTRPTRTYHAETIAARKAKGGG